MPLLEVRDLRTSFFLEGGEARAVDGVSFALDAGRVLGLVGESGCGKSVTALSLMRAVRGAGLAMIFQEPMTSLNPVFTVGSQIAEAVRLHRPVSRREAWERAVELLAEVGIPDSARRARDYPHRLSGGMRQRVMIAMAISCEPRALIADEPTTALDVTIQAEILDLLRVLREQRGMALLLITHDLGVVAEQADEVAIMYAGRIVEHAPVLAIFDRPLHPYTQGLFRSMPGISGRHDRLEAIPGQVPDLLRLPSGCTFRDRCPQAIADCAGVAPPLEEHAPGHRAACPGAGRGRRVARHPAGRDPRPGRRVGLGEVDARASHAAPHRAHLGGGDVRRALAPGARGARAARAPPRDADHLPGPLRLARSAHARREHRRRRARDPWPRSTRATPGAGERAARAGGPAARGRAPLSARVQRRPAPAHRHRAGPRRRPPLRGGRRGRLGPRRLDPGADPEPAAGSAPAPRPHHALHRARPPHHRAPERPGGGHVPGEDRRAGAPRGDLHEPPASLYSRPSLRGPGSRSAAAKATNGVGW